MAEEPEQLRIETSAGWAVEPIEGGTHTALIFKMNDGPFGVAMNFNDLSRFTERILTEMAKLTATLTPGQPPEKMTANPIPATSIGFAPHPHDNSSALLAVSVGNFQLSFEVDATTLVKRCKSVVANAQELGPRKSN